MAKLYVEVEIRCDGKNCMDACLLLNPEMTNSCLKFGILRDDYHSVEHVYFRHPRCVAEAHEKEDK